MLQERVSHLLHGGNLLLDVSLHHLQLVLLQAVDQIGFFCNPPFQTADPVGRQKALKFGLGAVIGDLRLGQFILHRFDQLHRHVAVQPVGILDIYLRPCGRQLCCLFGFAGTGGDLDQISLGSAAWRRDCCSFNLFNQLDRRSLFFVERIAEPFGHHFCNRVARHQPHQGYTPRVGWIFCVQRRPKIFIKLDVSAGAGNGEGCRGRVDWRRDRTLDQHNPRSNQRGQHHDRQDLPAPGDQHVKVLAQVDLVVHIRLCWRHLIGFLHRGLSLLLDLFAYRRCPAARCTLSHLHLWRCTAYRLSLYAR